MMIRSMRLATSLVNTWKEIGGWFPRRDRDTESKLRLRQERYDSVSPIINLGNTLFFLTPEQYDHFEIDSSLVWNLGPDIEAIIQPGTARRLLNDLMPPQPTEYPCEAWVKAPGWGGRGKEQVMLQSGLDVPGGWDVQVHVEGQEYRAITVGHKVVQGYERHGPNGDRSYTWTGVSGLPEDVKAYAKEAANMLHGNNFIAWDLIMDNDGAVFLFEGNSCPGVNLATAQRVLAQMEGRHYAPVSN